MVRAAVWENAIGVRTNQVQYLSTYASDFLDTVKSLLTNGYVVVFGTYIHSWQFTTISDDLLTEEDNAFVGKPVGYWLNGSSGGHAMTIVGYNDHLWVDINGNGTVDSGEKGALRIANSWGAGWKDGGFAWFAYDAINSPSAVDGGPNTGRTRGMYSNAYHLVPKSTYTPRLVAEFTLNHARRNQLYIRLGISDLHQDTCQSYWTPKALSYAGGPYAFDGTTTPVDATFVLDFSDLLPSSSFDKKMYLVTDDNAAGYIASLDDYGVKETGGSDVVYSADPPLAVDAGQALADVEYSYYDGNVPPTAVLGADPISGDAPLVVTFDASSSYDTNRKSTRLNSSH